MASCMTPIPIPAIPKPLKMYKPNNKGILEMERRMIQASGTKNKCSIKTVLKTIHPLPYGSILLLLKYSETRDWSVAEKSESTDFGNDNLLIKLELRTIYSNKEGNDAGDSRF